MLQRNDNGIGHSLIADAAMRSVPVPLSPELQGEGHSGTAVEPGQKPPAFALHPIINEIREQWRQRQAWHRAEKSLTLQSKALCRAVTRGDKKDADKLYNAVLGKGEHAMAEIALGAILPLIEGRKVIEKSRKAIEKRLLNLAEKLPVAPWVATVRGFGLNQLAGIVGEAGDLSLYPDHSKLWKRMGMAVMPDGTRQRRITGDEAIEHGYSPSRRALVWTIGDTMIRAKGPMKSLYDARKVIEAERTATKAHAHNRAKRYIEKRLLRDLWRAWRRAIADLPDKAKFDVPAELTAGIQ